MERPRDKHEKIYQAALILFGKFGLQKVNMQEIADAARVSKKTLYNHFNGKEDLFDKTIEWHVKEIIDFFEDLDKNNEIPLIDKFNKAIQFAFETLGYKTSHIFSDLQRNNRYLGSVPINHIRRNIKKQISHLVSEAQEVGICRNDISAELVSDIIILQMNGILTWEKFDEDTDINSSDIFNTSFALLIRSLLTEKGARDIETGNLKFNLNV